MNKTVVALIAASLFMVAAFQNCGGSDGGPAPVANDSVTNNDQTLQTSCREADFVATTLIYDNAEHIIPTPPIQSARTTRNNIITADVVMTINLSSGAVNVDDEGTVCSLTLGTNELQVLKRLSLGNKILWIRRSKCHSQFVSARRESRGDQYGFSD